jgi:hypothetical protein
MNELWATRQKYSLRACHNFLNRLWLLTQNRLLAAFNTHGNEDQYPTLQSSWILYSTSSGLIVRGPQSSLSSPTNRGTLKEQEDAFIFHQNCLICISTIWRSHFPKNRDSQSYMITILHQLSIYTSMKYSLLQTLKISACASFFRHPVWH